MILINRVKTKIRKTVTEKINYTDKIESYKDKIIETLEELIAFKSVVDEEEGGYPFGKEVHRAFMYMLEMARAEGYDTLNVENYGGHIEIPGYELDGDGEVVATAQETLGIPIHLDVVPAGSDWDTDPFKAEIKDGRIYGRGTTDNKGAAVAVYFAIKSLISSGFVPSKNIRIILGLDEETNWKGMEYYMEHVDKPDFGFAPDADFPVINGEMGILVFELARKLEATNDKGIQLRSISGGETANMVPDSARAVVLADKYDDIKERLALFVEETGYDIKAKGAGKALEIKATGKSAHGAKPQDGLNAISILMSFLGRVGFANEGVKDFIDFYNTCIGFESNGESMGIGLSDDASGNLIFNTGTIKMDKNAAILTVNVRYPVTCSDEDVYSGLVPVLEKYNLGIVKENHKAPIYYPVDHPFITTLMDVYRKNTGDEDSEPLVIGGGTFARAIPGGVAFGPRFPGEPEVQHQKNEYIEIDSLMKITKIYADAIYELTKPETDTK